MPLLPSFRNVLSIFLLLGVSTPAARAQIVRDGTLRSNSVVNQVGTQWDITQGETIGTNLFHSFSQFNLGTGETAYFQNAATIENIIARITGGTSSIIDGTLQTNGNANLFLINPSGLIFGPNARLNVGGSFVASTAESVRFADGSSFSATNPQVPSLLTINVPLGLQLGNNPGNIILRAQQLIPTSPPPMPDRAIAFVGGNILLDGAQIQSPQSRIELGAVGPNGFVNLTAANNGLVLGYDGLQSFQDIQLVRGATVDASGDRGGAIQVRGRQIAIADGSQLQSTTRGSQPGGDILLRGTERVTVSGSDPARFTVVSSDTAGAGAGGNLTVETGQFLLQGTAFLSTSTSGSGVGGNLTIRASQGTVLAGVGFPALEQFLAGTLSGQLRPSDRIGGLFSVTSGTAPGGEINLETGSLMLQNGAIAFSPTFGQAAGGNINVRAAGSVEVVSSAFVTGTNFGIQGAAGHISIQSSGVSIQDGSVLSAGTLGNGRGGDITLETSDFVDIGSPRAGAIFPTGIANNTLGNGAGGDIRIATGRLTIRDAIVSTSSGGATAMGLIPFGGPGGDILIEARESVEITGGAASSVSGQTGGVLPSGPSTTTFTASPAGDLTLRAPRLILGDGAIASSATLSSGNGGNLTVEASESVELIGQSSVTGLPTSLTTSSGRADLSQLVATGNGGNLTLRTGALVLRDGATLDVRSLRSGAAGTLNVAANSILLDRGSSLNASTVAGAGGNIFLSANSIILRRGSTISTDAGNTDGGNIIINTKNLAAVPQEDSDISANSLNSRGGNVTVSASGGIFGIQFRDRDTPLSDITATGRDSSLSGTVTITTLGFDPASGLEQLPEDVTDPTQQIAVGCATYSESRFTVTGRGGLPEDPIATIQGQTVWRDFQDFASTATDKQDSVRSDLVTLPDSASGVEATGWIVNAAGNVELVVAWPETPNIAVRLPQCSELGVSPRAETLDAK